MDKGTSQTTISNTDAMITTENWHHVAMTYDENELNIFVDGLVVYSTIIEGDNINESNNVIIGGFFEYGINMHL